MLERFWLDLRYSRRALAKSPGFTTIAVLSLALGVGATCAAFSFADALLLRPLPVPRPSGVLTVGSTSAIENFSSLVASYREYVDIRDRARSFAGLSAFTDTLVGFVSAPEAPSNLRIGMLVSGNFFEVMGVSPHLGRAFRRDEDQVPGRDAVVVLGHDFWEQQFGADPSVLGRTVRLNGIEFTVIGIAPDSFPGLDQLVRFDFYAPLMMWERLTTDPSVKPLEARDFRSVTIKGRLKPGVTIADAQAELAVIGRDLERAYPETNRNRAITVRTELQTRIAGDQASARFVAVLAMLAAIVLLVACANVAGLLTSRAPVRAREIALRLAMGAGRLRVLQQLITESLLLALLGGLLGLGVGYAGVVLFRQFRIPTDLPIAFRFELDRRVMVFSLAVAMASVVLFGLIPAIQTTRADLTSVMKSTDAIAFGRRRRWGRALLVVGQVAMSVVLLVVALFVNRDARRLLRAGPGYRTDHLMMVTLEPGLMRYTDAQSQRLFEQVAERARSAPGVKSVALASSVPMNTDPAGGISIVPEGFRFPAGQEYVSVLSSAVDEHYFDTMAIPITSGRAFRATDSANAPRVAIINEQLARHYWPDQDPLGKRLRLNDARGPLVEIVGVAKTGTYIFIAESPREFLYFPYRQRPQPRMVVLAESLADAAGLAAPLRSVVRALDPNLPLYNVRSMEELYHMRTTAQFNIIVTVLTGMGVMGLGLAIVGLYGLVAYAASRRTREIGIRMAIGASRSDVLRMVLRQGMKLALIGLGVGLLASLGAQRALTAAVFAGAPLDPLALLLVGLAVLAVTLLAAYLPAHRAASVSPSTALRYE